MSIFIYKYCCIPTEFSDCVVFSFNLNNVRIKILSLSKPFLLIQDYICHSRYKEVLNVAFNTYHGSVCL